MSVSPRELMQQLRTLKGAPLSILAAMFSLSRPVGTGQLCRFTGYAHEAVEEGLGVLAAQELVQRVSYHKGWILTSQARQLSFFGGQLEPLAENQQVEGGSSFKDLNQDQLLKPLLLSLADYQHVTITNSLVQSLLSIGGVGHKAALDAVERALCEKGISPAELQRRIDVCAAYASGATSLKWAGSWAAGIIGAGFEPPAPRGQAAEVDRLSRFDGYLDHLSTTPVDNSVDNFAQNEGGAA